MCVFSQSVTSEYTRCDICPQKFKCSHKRGSHDQAHGQNTKGTETYPLALCIAMLAGLFMSAKYTPAMSVRPVRPSVAHRSATLETGFVPSPLMWSEIFAMKRKYKRKLYKKMFKKGTAAAVALSRRWSPDVWATDAAPCGIGVCRSAWHNRSV